MATTKPNSTSQEFKNIINGLSTSRVDHDLIDEGLKNKGLLGFILSDERSNATPFFYYRLHDYRRLLGHKDLFYTAEENKEKIEGRKIEKKGIIGFVHLNPEAETIRLHRFFNPVQGDHLFVTNPHTEKLLSIGYSDETNENSLYIYGRQVNGSLPLYFYSNSVEILFTPLSTRETRVDEFWKLIDKKFIARDRFSIPPLNPGDQSITVFVNDSLFNFEVNPITNGDFFTVKRNPESKSSEFIVTEIDSWFKVTALFETWLGEIKEKFGPISEKIELPENINLTLSKSIYRTNEIKIRDTHDIEPALGVKELAGEIVKVIKNLKPEPGNMTGIFGPWGRGKTFLMNQIWKLLEVEKDVVYFKVSYQAWRYQDTPASWAYLYERFSEQYLGDKRVSFKSLKNTGLGRFFRYYLNLWDLNLEREGSFSLYSGIFLFLSIGVASTIVIPFQGFWDAMIRIVVSPMIFFLYKNIKLDHFTKAINLIKKYGVRTSFKENLGIQAEIQKELIHIIKAWTDSKKKKRIVLFVDDLDRCREEKTIEIIDSLRIILDDEEIKDKLIVIAAIDERILQMAVSKKYQGTESYDPRDLVREYIDKLFIFSLKLGSLSHSESQDYFDKLTKDDIYVNKNELPLKKQFSDQTKVENVEPFQGLENNDVQLPSDTGKLIIENIDKLSQNEAQLLKKLLSFVKHPTPRRIRVLYYRYLLAKNILIAKYSIQTQNCYWLTGNNHDTFIRLLIHFSQGDTKGIVEQRELAENEKSEDYELRLWDSQKIFRQEYIDLLNVLELVIAY